MTATVQFRSSTNPRVRTFAVLADAIAWGRSEREPFDVSTNSGAIIWAWEQRDIGRQHGRDA